MPRTFSRALAALSTPAAALLLAGCSNGPGRVEAPSISASGAASEALELYDKDGDGFIADAELDAVPGIKAALETIDGNQDGKVTADEIESRIEKWQEYSYGVMPITFGFTLDGKPLTDAEITFEPESFLGSDIKAAVSTTGPTGGASMSVPKEQRPAADTPAGVQLGFYRVRVSKKVNGKETLPAKFNVETGLGQQISPDDPAIAGKNLKFDLKTQ